MAKKIRKVTVLPDEEENLSEKNLPAEPGILPFTDRFRKENESELPDPLTDMDPERNLGHR